MNSQTISVLLVEDNPGDARLVRERLADAPGAPFRLECAERLATGISRLSEGGVDVLLLDLGLPDSQGLATFERFHASAPAVPVVVLSGMSDEQLGMEAVQAGAQDYLVKGNAGNQLLARALRYAIERKRAQDQIHQLNAELEQRVLERTAELESANRELGSFAYSISHDLRVPLRAINGFAQMVLEDYADGLPADAQRLLQVIYAKAVQMGELIDGLLAFSRLGRQSLDKKLLAPADLVRQALKDLRSEQNGRQVEITIADLPPCEADSLLLHQVFLNLLSNALKFTSKREIARIEVGTLKPEDLQTQFLGVADTSSTVYYVRDNGAGFDMKYADKLFGVFQRLHGVEGYPGTGIGLSIVQRIVHRHGGRIWADAAVDRGATFYFTLGTRRTNAQAEACCLPEESDRQ